MTMECIYQEIKIVYPTRRPGVKKKQKNNNIELQNTSPIPLQMIGLSTDSDAAEDYGVVEGAASEVDYGVT